MPTFNIERARPDTPGASGVVYSINAGATVMPSQVLGTVIRHLRRVSVIGGCQAESEAHDKIEAMYTSIGRLLNCSSADIAFLKVAATAQPRTRFGRNVHRASKMRERVQ